MTSERMIRVSGVASLLTATALLLAGALQSSSAQSSGAVPPQPGAGPSIDGRWGDQGDGSYANPVLPADFSDIDVIARGQDFYAISSTFQYSPGMVVLHSRDLVNWGIVGHVVPNVTSLDPELNWNRMGRRGRGIWAGSIRFHGGRFFVYFGTPDQGIFMASAADPADPWTATKLLLAAAGWDDPCPFWDDDGSAYLVATHFVTEEGNGRKYNIHLFRMAAEGDALVPGADRIIHQSRGSEANKLYKIHGLYFHDYSEVAAEGRVAMMERAKSLDGPWEIRQLIHVNPKLDKEPNQGGLVRGPLGQVVLPVASGNRRLGGSRRRSASSDMDRRLADLGPGRQ